MIISSIACCFRRKDQFTYIMRIMCAGRPMYKNVYCVRAANSAATGGRCWRFRVFKCILTSYNSL